MSAPAENKFAVGHGRPKISVESLWPGWEAEIIDLYRKGKSDAQVKAYIYEKTDGKIRCSNDLWYRWLKEESSFSETVEGGHILSEGNWMDKLEKGQEDPNFKLGIFDRNVQFRFGLVPETAQKIKATVEDSGITYEKLKQLADNVGFPLGGGEGRSDAGDSEG